MMKRTCYSAIFLLLSIGSVCANDTASVGGREFVSPAHLVSFHKTEMDSYHNGTVGTKTNCYRVDKTCTQNSLKYESCYYVCTSSLDYYPHEPQKISLQSLLYSAHTAIMTANIVRIYREGPLNKVACFKLLTSAGVAAGLAGLNWALIGCPTDTDLGMFLLSLALGASAGSV